jgi:hypothetical protein
VADVAEKMDQIAGILTRQKIPFEETEDGSKYRVLAGSTAVFISAISYRDGTAVHLDAPVVVDFDMKEQIARAILAANELNIKSYFGKFTVYGEDARGTISVEMDVLGDDLQASELTNALMIVAGLADETDDRLEAEIGGKTYAELVKEQEQPLET